MSDLWSRDEDQKRGIKPNGEHAGVDTGTEGNKRGKTITSGFHHIALVCKDMKETIKFYEEALGMKLRAIFPMHGVEGAKHCFLEAGNGAEISFVEFSTPREGVPGVSFSERNNTDSPVGTHHHMAYKADNIEHLYKLREQIKAAGYPVSKVIDHGFLNSFYFEDPNGFHLEVTTTTRPYRSSEYDPSLLYNKVDISKYDWDEAKQIQSARRYAEKHIDKSKL